MTEGQKRYAKYKNSYDRYRKRNRQRKKELNEHDRDRIRFGGNRVMALERDGFRCVLCGMDREEHKERYVEKDLVVHHVDGNGRGKETKNNELDNLRTLCIPCHRKVHAGTESI